MKLFTDFLREIRKGRIVDEASEVLAELVKAVDQTNKPGSMTVKITVKPAKDGGWEKVIVPDVQASIPRKDLPDAIFFSNPEGHLVREDPSQREMFTPVEDVERPGRFARD